MTYSLEEKVKWLAITSRAAVLVLQMVANLILPDHDAGVFTSPLPARNNTIADDVITLLLGGLTRWDGQYFLHIAAYGYTYENTLAFFPLFPLLVRYPNYMALNLEDYIHHLLWFLVSWNNVLILVGVFINNALFVMTALLMFQLSREVLKNEQLAYISAVLFCFNPASIFFSALYSESLFCYLTFYALLKMELRTTFVTNIVVALTAITRSNGLLNIYFIVYHYLKLRIRGHLSALFDIIHSAGLVFTMLPFLAYQLYCYTKFCLPSRSSLPGFLELHAEQNDYVRPGEGGPWCNYSLPIAYSYVQNHYWNVGIFRYYELKQLPNFLLAAPVLFIVWRGAYRFVAHYKWELQHLGCFDERIVDGQLPVTAFMYVLHVFGLSLFSVLVVHVQVSTRLIASASPAFYWFCAQAVYECLRGTATPRPGLKMVRRPLFSTETSVAMKSKWRTFFFLRSLRGYALFIQSYFLLYIFLGCVMFSNFLPWT